MRVECARFIVDDVDFYTGQEVSSFSTVRWAIVWATNCNGSIPVLRSFLPSMDAHQQILSAS